MTTEERFEAWWAEEVKKRTYPAMAGAFKKEAECAYLAASSDADAMREAIAGRCGDCFSSNAPHVCYDCDCPLYPYSPYRKEK